MLDIVELCESNRPRVCPDSDVREQLERLKEYNDEFDSKLWKTEEAPLSPIGLSVNKM